MSRQTDTISRHDLLELLDHDENEDGPLGDKIDTHSGYWLKDGLETYRFVWTIEPEDR